MSVARLSRVLLGTAVIGAIAAPFVISPGGMELSAKRSTTKVEQRVSEAPNVFYPTVSRYAKDQRLFRKRLGTEINAPCGSAVRAVSAGTALVSSSNASGPNLVRVVTSKGKLVSYYGYMRRARVADGDIVAAGQQIGNIGKEGMAKRCSLYFAMTNNGKQINPSRWLYRNVGKPLPQSSLFDNDGFILASFNALGASHTPNKRYPAQSARTPKQLAMLNEYKVDVVGLQEFETTQRSAFLAAADDAYGIWPAPTAKVSANSIIWNKSTMEFVSGSTVGVPYFRGRIWQMPVVLLKELATGRTAYFINVHNPASIPKYGDHSKWRAKAIAIERAKVIELRKTGRPVFLMGDLNDREKAFCPLTAGKLMISANSIPSYKCAPPAKLWIDWIFAAGPARFTEYSLDQTPKTQKLSDHPIVLTRVHLAE